MENGRLVLLLRMSWIETPRATESSMSWIKVQLWQLGSLQLGAFWLVKSDGRFAFPARCCRLWVGDGTPVVGRIWLRCSRRPMDFGLLEVLTKRILDPTASKIWGSGQM